MDPSQHNTGDLFDHPDGRMVAFAWIVISWTGRCTSHRAGVRAVINGSLDALGVWVLAIFGNRGNDYGFQILTYEGRFIRQGDSKK